MLPALTDAQRQTIKEHGTPLPLFDDATGTAYMLLAIECHPNPDDDSFIAHIPTIGAYGEGGTEEEAALALMEALRSYLKAFS